MPIHEIEYRHGDLTVTVTLMSELPAASKLPDDMSGDVDHEELARVAVSKGRMYAGNLARVPRK